MKNPWAIGFSALGVVLLGVGHYAGLFVAPPEAMMGDVGRILYVHVPTAWLALLTYFIAFIAACGALASGRGSTSTATPLLPARPARPACCHIDETEPGKPSSSTTSRCPGQRIPCGSRG